MGGRDSVGESGEWVARALSCPGAEAHLPHPGGVHEAVAGAAGGGSGVRDLAGQGSGPWTIFGDEIGTGGTKCKLGKGGMAVAWA